MHWRTRAIISVAAMAAVLGIVSAVSAAAPQAGRAQDHASILAYWTPDRVANAKPREISPDKGPDAIAPQKPSGGGGKPGGSTSTGTGASWTGGGLVQRTVGKVLFTMAGTDYVCSATVVQDNRLTESLVLTAGHCVYDQADGWATNWMFMPAFEDAPSPYNGTFNCGILTFGCWTATSLVTSTGWSNGDFNEDYGFAVMGLGGKSATLLEEAVGAQAISFTGTRPATVYAFGYPQAYPYDGTDLVYCNGSTVADGWGGSTDSGLNCTMTGGSSGGGWFSPFDTAAGAGTLVSVNSFKYTRGPYAKYMFGPLFDGDTAATYAAAQTATANTFS